MRYCITDEQLKAWLQWSFNEGQNFMTGFEWSWEKFRIELEKRQRLQIPDDATHWAKIGQLSMLVYETKLLGEI